MNKSKKNLIIATIVLNFVSVATLIGLFVASLISTIKAPVEDFVNGNKTFDIVYYCVIYLIQILGMSASAVLLLISISKNGINFIKYRKLYIVAIFINIFLDTFSIASLLLIISYFRYIDIEVIKDNEEVKSEEDLKNKIAKLRKLKDDGVISEKEFNDQIMKLL